MIIPLYIYQFNKSNKYGSLICYDCKIFIKLATFFTNKPLRLTNLCTENESDADSDNSSNSKHYS